MEVVVSFRPGRFTPWKNPLVPIK